MVPISARALLAWAGTDRLSALPARIPRTPATTPAGAVLALFVGGADVPIELLRALDLEALQRAELIDVTGAIARARVAVLPLGASLIVCDRLDAPVERDLVCWPDDSSYHLAAALPPGRSERWLDIGTGSAFAPLARPGLGAAIVGIEVNPRAARYARIGAALSGIEHLTVYEAELGDGVPAAWRGLCALVSCNAPIPEVGDDPFRPRWRAAPSDVVARVFDVAARMIATGGTIVVHAALDALAPVVAELSGERVVVAYTPAHAVRDFAVAWWSPDREPRHVTARRPLTDLHPHVTHEDRTAALDGLVAC